MRRAPSRSRACATSVQISGGIAVVADDFWTAKKGADALKVVWDEGRHAKLSSAEIRKTQVEAARQPGKVGRNDGDANKALGEATQKIEAVYTVPFLDPACMEPINATAHWTGDWVEIWAPTQTQAATQQAAMDQFGLPRREGAVHTTLPRRRLRAASAKPTSSSTRSRSPRRSAAAGEGRSGRARRT